MNYTPEEVMQYVREEDVKFIRLAFCDCYGRQKNISIMPAELARAFACGMAFDASAIDGFGDEAHSDLLLRPDPTTLTVLPWRPEHGRVVRMYADITYPDQRPFEGDTRALLKRAVRDAQKLGVSFVFGAEMEFYLLQLDDNGRPTRVPYDEAGYMDMAPEDKGENIRREICLMLEQMGIRPESSHHEMGPGQNEIDFRYSDPLSAADNALTFQTVVKIAAGRNGLQADFSPKPLIDQPGSGMHINISAQNAAQEDLLPYLIAGILDKISALTIFLNPSVPSYERFGSHKAPRYISWSNENRSQLIRVPAAVGEFRRAELRSPDGLANPYLAFALLIYAGLYGIQNKLLPPPPANINLFTASPSVLEGFKMLPASREAAVQAMLASSFVQEILPRRIIDLYSQK